MPATLIFYEAPGRLAETLADLAPELGPRPAAVARELTKLHEEVAARRPRRARRRICGQAARRRAKSSSSSAPPEARPAISEDALDREIAERSEACRSRTLRRRSPRKHGLPRRQVYARTLRWRAPRGERAGRDERTSADAAPIFTASRRNGSPRCLLRLKGYRSWRAGSSSRAAKSISSRGAAARSPSSRSRRGPISRVAAIAISATKRRRIARAARVWLTRNPWAAGLTLAGRRRLRRARSASPSRAGRV